MPAGQYEGLTALALKRLCKERGLDVSTAGRDKARLIALLEGGGAQVPEAPAASSPSAPAAEEAAAPIGGGEGGTPEWFHGAISKGEAEALLSERGLYDGDFLVRRGDGAFSVQPPPATHPLPLTASRTDGGVWLAMVFHRAVTQQRLTIGADKCVCARRQRLGSRGSPGCVSVSEAVALLSSDRMLADRHTIAPGWPMQLGRGLRRNGTRMAPGWTADRPPAAAAALRRVHWGGSATGAGAVTAKDGGAVAADMALVPRNDAGPSKLQHRRCRRPPSPPSTLLSPSPQVRGSLGPGRRRSSRAAGLQSGRVAAGVGRGRAAG